MWLCDLVPTQNIGDKSLCNGSKDTFKRLFFYDAFIIPYQVKLSFKHVSRWSGALFNFCHVMKAILKSAIRMNVIFSHINAGYLLSTDREKCSYCEALSFFDYPLSSKFLIWICTPAESNTPKKKLKWHMKYRFQVEFYYFFFANVLTGHTENAKTNIITNWKINLNETTIRFPQRFFYNLFCMTIEKHR